MARPPVPHRPEAEKAIIGEMVLLPERIEDIERVLEPGDFYDRTCAVAYGLLVEGWSHGKPLNEAALLAALEDARYPSTPTWVTEAVTSAGAWRIHADRVLADRARRQLLAIGAQITKDARSQQDPGAVADKAQAELAHIDGPLPRTWDSAHDWEWYLDQTIEDYREWVIPGLLRRRWRCMVVAAEGGGKSTLLRQFAMLAGQGLHPFHYTPMTHRKVLYVDMENDPYGAGHEQANKMRRSFGEDYLPGQVLHIPEQRGINLLARTDRRRLEAAIAGHRPDLLLIGPVYRMHRRTPHVSDEEAAATVQEVLDDFRIRYDLAVLAEHHAPKGSGGFREMLPFGTSLWLRWPELGIGLEREDTGRFVVKHWREPREKHQWPVRLSWGDRFPWLGEWEDNSWQEIMF